MCIRDRLVEGPTASAVVSERERADKVRSAIERLSPTDQEILLMRNYEAMSYEEIAVVLQIEIATARRRNGRALVRLHKLLVDDGLTESQL